MITLNNLTYYYPHTTQPAADNCTAVINPGINLLLGENGAGKTTLLHIIAGLLTPSSGNVTIDGLTPSLREPALMNSVYLLTDEMTLPCRDINQLAKIHGCFYPGFDADMLRDNLTDFGLTGDEDYSNLSLGNRRKSQIAYALALRVKVLLLDEPANGLDITSKQAMQQMLIKCVDETQTVLLSTHTTADFEYLYDAIVMMSRARLLLSMPTWQISSRLQFSSEMLPPAEPLYLEQRMGLYKAITPNHGEADSKIDYTLLYNALLSPASAKIISHLTTHHHND